MKLMPQLMALFVFAGIGSLVYSFFVNGPLTPYDPLISLLAFYSSAAIQLAVHEFGHWWWGRRSGLVLRALGIGPFRYTVGQGWRWAPLSLFVSAWVWMLPSPGLSWADLRTGFRTMLLGGPLTGLAVCGPCWVVALSLPGGLTRALVETLAFSGTVLSLGNLVPFRAGRVTSDGEKLWRLHRGAPETLASLALQALSVRMQHQRPRDWDTALVEAVRGPHSAASATASAWLFAALWALDRGDLDQAEIWMAEVSAAARQAPPPLQAAFAEEVAYLRARQGFPAEARATLDAHSQQPVLSPCTRARVIASILVAEGQLAQASEAVREARRHLGDPTTAFGVEAALLGDLEAQLLMLTHPPESAPDHSTLTVPGG
jgi:hypothetical protein